MTKNSSRAKGLKVIFLSLLFILLAGFAYIQYHGMKLSEAGLIILAWVKDIRGEGVPLEDLNSKHTANMNHHPWTALLKQYVDEGGLVDYEGFQKDEEALDHYLDSLSYHPPGSNWSEEEQLAYWINAYNAFTVKLILDHYPLKSIKDIGGGGITMINSPWDIKFFTIGEVSMDLNTIEHEILRKQFDEPRIHFAINCASISCPKLRNEAFTAEKLEEQLEDQAMDFINDPSKNLFTDTYIHLSSIFNWFESDFTKQTDLLSFIAAYKIDLNRSAKLSFLEYDWGLNH